MTQVLRSFERPLVTIAIPTWNRSSELYQCIELIAKQIEATDELIDVVVSDNASDDDTVETLQRMAARYAFVRFYRNKTNIGADLNFLEAFKRSSGRYVWLFSDDDVMTNGALAEIVRIIRTHEPSQITTNWRSCDIDGQIVQQSNRANMVSSDIIDADVDEVFLRRNHWLSFMSCNIFRRDLLDIAQYEYHADHVKNWIQVYVIAHVLACAGRGYLSSFYAVHRRAEDELRYDRRVFVANMPDAFNYILKRFSQNDSTRVKVLSEMRSQILDFKSFVRCHAYGIEPSPLFKPWVPFYYNIAFLLPRKLILEIWNARRRLWAS